MPRISAAQVRVLNSFVLTSPDRKYSAILIAQLVAWGKLRISDWPGSSDIVHAGRLLIKFASCVHKFNGLVLSFLHVPAYALL